MKEKPILFSGAMVKAILAGRKTQTRRVIKPQPKIVHGWNGDRLVTNQIFRDGRQGLSSPYGLISDCLWVRESGLIATDKSAFIFRDDSERIAPGHEGTESDYREWKACPSIHQPRWASRLTLKITNLRAERLIEITDEDAQAEGVTPREFKALWNAINGNRYPWASNPWVWVIEFKVLNRP